MLHRRTSTAQITLRAFQTGRVPAADVVMVLDVSGSMEKNTPVALSEIDGAKEYFIRYVHRITVDGESIVKQEDVKVHNTAPAGQTPTWYAQLEAGDPERQIIPGDGKNGTYVFYTGAMEALRAAATDFVASVAQNAADYAADHRVAVVEFSSPEKKNDASRGTHALPYYANILSGDGTPGGALLSVKDSGAQLRQIFDGLTAAGPTYSDDAMAQAEAILALSDAQRRVAILFTDGGPGSYGWTYDNDGTSLPTANGAIASAKRMKDSGVLVYTIGVFNEENLAGEVGEKNTTYLSLISSDYPQAQSMTESGEQTAEGFCSIGDLHMDLTGAFGGISAALGVPVEQAQVVDTVSKYFYLTDAQRAALTAAYPGVQITDNADGSTRIELDDVQLPPVAVREDGTVENDDGVFSMTFSVTRRPEFLGGSGVATNSGVCGVFAEGLQIAQFPTPQVTVPASAEAVEKLLEGQPKTLYAGQTLSTAELYTDLSGGTGADFAQITYSVTDPSGAPFTEGPVDASGDYTVRVRAVIAGETVEKEKTVRVTVLEDTPTAIEITRLPDKTEYFVGQSVNLKGIEVRATMRSGKTQTVPVSQLTVSPAVLSTTGEQTVSVSFAGARQTFKVRVNAVVPVSAHVIALPDKSSYTYKREEPDFTGLVVYVKMNDGSSVTVRDLSQMRIVPESASRVRFGEKTFRVTTMGVSTTFPMQVRMTWWQWLIVILLFGWIWY